MVFCVLGVLHLIYIVRGEAEKGRFWVDKEIFFAFFLVVCGIILIFAKSKINFEYYDRRKSNIKLS